MQEEFNNWWDGHSEDKFFSSVTTSEANTIWQTAWNAALEKAAGVAWQAVSPDGFDSGVNDLLLDVREAIRALKEE